MSNSRKGTLGRKVAVAGAIALGLILLFAASSQAAAAKWKLLGLTGPTYLPPKQSEIEKLTIEATGGTFRLTFDGETTAPIDYAASAPLLQGALEALPAIGPGGVKVSGGPGGEPENPYFVEFVGPLAEQDVNQLEPDGSGLGGEHPGALIFTPLPGGPGTGILAIDPANIGALATRGTYTLEIGPLPAGIVFGGPPSEALSWTCTGAAGGTPVAAGDTSVRCTSESPVPGISPSNNVDLPLRIEPSTATSGPVPVTIYGAGAGSDAIAVPMVVSKQDAPNGAAAFWAGFYDEDGNLESQAGGHPYSAETFFEQNTVRTPAGKISTIGDPKNVIVDLPPGFLGDPLATKRCPQAQVISNDSPLCNDEMSVGRFEPSITEFGEASSQPSLFYDDVPPYGYPAEFTTKIASPLQSLLVSVASSENYQIRVTGAQISHYARVYGAFTAIDGFPQGGEGKAFFRNPTSCNGEPLIPRTKSDTYQEQGVFSLTTEQFLPPVYGCDKLQFHPGFAFVPTTTTGSSGAGAAIDLHVPQENLTDADTTPTPDLKRAEVRLPPGVVLNPSSAEGLEGCSEAQVGFIGDNFPAPNPIHFDESQPTCPDGSKLGTVEIESPLVEDPVVGALYLASPEDNPFHALLGVYVVVNDPRTGVLIKLPGEVQRDPTTGQLTAIFDNNPQLPFEDLKIVIRGGGSRSQLTTPEVCGHYEASGSLTPWSAPQSGPPAAISEAGFDVTDGCASSSGARRFAPTFEAGTAAPTAGAYQPLMVKIGRSDGEGELRTIDFTLPKGLIGKLVGIATCSDASIAEAGGKTGRQEQASSSCPGSSRLGSIDAAAGVGSSPFHVAGALYLAGPYKGAPLSTVAITPALAGPFDLGNVVVRAPLYVDRETAALTVKTDPLPTILKGFPLKIRSVEIKVDRPGFILNPTSCEEAAATAAIRSGDGALATPANRFQVGGCDKLKFSPKLKISLKGRTRRGGHPSLTAVLTQPPGQANIGRVSVALPRSEFLEQGHIKKNCTRAQFAAEACPAASIYGYAEAVTPLLAQPLAGPVYLRSSSHKLPDLAVVLKGPPSQPIEIDLDGRIDSVRGGIRTTFDTVPDAPVSKFTLRLPAGKKSLIVNSADICKGAHKAAVAMRGQNGLTHNFATRLHAQCGKAKHGRGKKGKHRVRHKKRRGRRH